MKPKRKGPDLFEVIAQQGRDIKALQAALARINIVTIKTTTGDLGSGYEGQVVINTFDNNIKQYADAAWRTLASW